MGGEESKIAVAKRPPTVIMMVGLQGAGKTTTTGKLANLLRKNITANRCSWLRIFTAPPRLNSWKHWGNSLICSVFSLGDQVSPVEIARQAIEKAKEEHHDYVILDTAGRLHIDHELMDELSGVKEVANPEEIFLVVDSMTRSGCGKRRQKL
ncbi:hypothetical protein ACSE3M_20215 [Bacillus velezensis]